MTHAMSYSLLNASPDSIILSDGEGRIVFVNVQTEKLFGYPRSELLGQELEVVVPERLRHGHRHQRDVYGEKFPIPRHMGTGLELFARRKNGTEFPVEISIAPIKEGDSTLYMSAVRDVTARKALERERDIAMQDRERVLGMIAHDLKTPLGAILLGAQLIARQLKKNAGLEVITQSLKRIENSGRRMNHLIDDILILKKIQSQIFEVYKERVSVKTVLDAVFEMMDPIALRKGIRIQKELPMRDASVFCDADRISQVLSNLLSNAIKFTEPLGVISVRVKSDAEGTHVAVSDSGSGISPEDLPHIFESYWQARKTASQGTGLGLAIVKGIIEAHGGRVWAESIPGAGSDFHFTLPSAVYFHVVESQDRAVSL